jgi:uncharacterized protein YyaL (SSP411 family)
MNRLAHESSPYLLQHQNNPVDWYPWGTAALDRARREQKPIFLSIGYAACHWCHVMEHESFENRELADFLNGHFVCIKVDREERPDLDHVYMQAVHVMGVRGGWPLSVFLTPDLQPFYGGTYWPPTSRGGMPGFDQVLNAIGDAWSNRRDMVTTQASQLTEHLRGQMLAKVPDRDRLPAADVLELARRRLAESFDEHFGGFGSAPKFPHAVDLQVLLRIANRQQDLEALRIVRVTLDRMAAGGIYDHLGGGFARYSVDERWLVPHFEKMLYDNALLATTYLEAYQVTGEAHYAHVAGEVLDYALRDLRDEAGGFHSTEDADSEGEEGKFYVWSRDEILATLGPELGDRFCRVYGVTQAGNFEGHNILHLARPLAQTAHTLGCAVAQLDVEMAAAREQLLARRNLRVRPGKDDKVLVSWNALLIQALALGSRILDRPAYLSAAQEAARFIRSTLRRPDGRLLHSWRQGRVGGDAFLDDYAALLAALIELYQADFHEPWIDWAVELAEWTLQHFADPECGDFFFTADDQEPLITRTKEVFDGSVPSSNGLLATSLEKLGRLTSRADLLAAADGILRATAAVLRSAPEAVGQLVLATDLQLGPTAEFVLINNPSAAETREIVRAYHQAFRPRHVIACRGGCDEAAQSTALDLLFTGKLRGEPGPVAYVCAGSTCSTPLVGVDPILEALKASQP